MSSTWITSIDNNDLTNTDLPLYLTDHNKVLAKEALHVLESMISSLKDNDPLANYMRNVLESIKSKMEAAGEANSDSVIPLFIDEISMLSLFEIYRISEWLCKTTGIIDKPFGGLNIIFSSDLLNYLHLEIKNYGKMLV